MATDSILLMAEPPLFKVAPCGVCGGKIRYYVGRPPCTWCLKIVHYDCLHLKYPLLDPPASKNTRVCIDCHEGDD